MSESHTMLTEQQLNWQSRAPNPFPPPWARSWGDDRFDLWANAQLANQVQRMRWIEAGAFEQTGSETMPQRVITVPGFWLANTACTPALWQALMQEDPSQSTGSNADESQNPVATVSSTQVQAFLQKVSSLLPQCQATLPSTTEWAFACHTEPDMPFDAGKPYHLADQTADSEHRIGFYFCLRPAQQRELNPPLATLFPQTTDEEVLGILAKPGRIMPDEDELKARIQAKLRAQDDASKA